MKDGCFPVAVFDASAKSETGVLFNDTLLEGPTIHSPLIDVNLQFRLAPEDKIEILNIHGTEEYAKPLV